MVPPEPMAMAEPAARMGIHRKSDFWPLTYAKAKPRAAPGYMAPMRCPKSPRIPQPSPTANATNRLRPILSERVIGRGFLGRLSGQLPKNGVSSFFRMSLHHHAFRLGAKKELTPFFSRA